MGENAECGDVQRKREGQELMGESPDGKWRCAWQVCVCVYLHVCTCHGSCLRPGFFPQYVTLGILTKTDDLILKITQALSHTLLCLAATNQ